MRQIGRKGEELGYGDAYSIGKGKGQKEAQKIYFALCLTIQPYIII